MRLVRFAALLIAIVLASGATPPGSLRAAEPVTVFAAASLTDAMTVLGEAYEERSGKAVRFSFAASSTLARQIEAGAPADIFVSASAWWMDYLEERGLIAAETRSEPITNRLALIAPETARFGDARIDASLDLPALLGREGRLAVGDPEHVPAGIYAKQALERLGFWAEIAPRLARADNVRAALALVARGEAPLGIAYATDARIAEGIIVLDLFPEDLHDSITYPFALVSGSDSPEAREFLAYLTGADGLAVFERFGFTRAQ